MRDPFACTDDGAMTPPPEPPLEVPTDSPRHSRHRQSGWQHWVPGLTVFRNYPIGWLRYDLVAGLVLTSLLIPSGIAYAAASGVPGVYGLYATIVPLLVYALFGPNRVLIMAPDSALAALILGLIMAQSGGDPQRAVALAGAMALVSGLVGVAGGFARFGFVTELLSKPIRYGFMNGIALTLLLSQLPKLFGIDVQASGVWLSTLATTEAVLTGGTNVASLGIGVACFALIIALKRFPNVPGTLIAIGGATIVVGVFDLGTTAGVVVLGTMPTGLPSLTLPLIGVDDIVPVVLGGTAVALVAFADTSVLSRTYAARLNLKVDPNQEMVGLGAANLVTGLFQGFPVSSSASRTPVALAAGSRSQLTGVVGAVSIALLLMFAPTLLKHLPMAALAAVVVAAAIAMFEIADLKRIYRIQRWEFWLSMVCFVGVATSARSKASVSPSGLPCSIRGTAAAAFGGACTSRWHERLSRRVEIPEREARAGPRAVRWDAPLFFANAELFRDRVPDAPRTRQTGRRASRLGRAGDERRRHSADVLAISTKRYVNSTSN